MYKTEDVQLRVEHVVWEAGVVSRPVGLQLQLVLVAHRSPLALNKGRGGGGNGG